MRDVNTTDTIYFHICKMSQNWRYKSEEPPTWQSLYQCFMQMYFMHTYDEKPTVITTSKWNLQLITVLINNASTIILS